MSVEFDLLIPWETVTESEPGVDENAGVAAASRVDAGVGAGPGLDGVGTVDGAGATIQSSVPVSEQGTITVRVEQVRREAAGVNSFVFTDPDGRSLPEWEPGDHLDVHLPSGTIRQYSLCGDRADRTSYRVAVLELPEGRGGSVEVHRELRPGQLIELGLPRSNFTLEDAPEYVFIAGGIGITPIVSMIHAAASAGKDWSLHFGAKSREHFAFLTEIDRCAEGAGGAVELCPQDEAGYLDLAAIVTEHPAAQIYCCGPGPLMDGLAALMEEAGRAEALHLERFTVDPVGRVSAGGGGEGDEVAGFEVELARTGGTVSVGPEETVLDAVRAAGIDHPSSCEMGICGTCETTVVSGEVDHRDDLLTEAEKQRGDCMMICVSRAKCPRLVLDL